ncbi:hypothetical protein M0R89_08405 [Halorussus limi]|uniref:Uncharacterized protein n=1 Tax=Halorussus limi TaxID=2938695 RepID=A0A8U0HZT7_9EURY|nr:hypothetical protein [Halorussus limi]UPV76064.1 hypothetical protein M0R89_08405 [Halorussus limi]
MSSDVEPTLRERVRRLGRALALGAALAAVAVPVLVLSGESVGFASEKIFAVGALVFGFSILGWSGSVFAGRGIENFQRHLGGRSDWSEADSRQAMAVLGSVGLGGMVGTVLATWVVAGVT